MDLLDQLDRTLANVTRKLELKARAAQPTVSKPRARSHKYHVTGGALPKPRRSRKKADLKAVLKGMTKGERLQYMKDRLNDGWAERNASATARRKKNNDSMREWRRNHPQVTEA